MHALKSMLCALTLPMAVSGCASKPSAAAPRQLPPPPAAWLMQVPPNSQQTLDRIISPSEISLPSASK
ncbi:hypothetical protein PspR84_01705 [Pseudomonas sp. R84]|nr:hypothetical protein PspR84_01705 [Pseudomonas sp. R84]